ncbi:MAG: hypothetical protein U0S49_01880 [Rhodospirillales bacterium]|nr:hypothetical protein [Rhodospirillales bacterium]
MTADLLQPPSRALQGFFGELLWKLDNSLLYRPVEKADICHPLEPALQIAASNELFDGANRALLVPHPLEYVGMIPTLFGQANAFVYEGFQIWTGFLQGLHTLMIRADSTECNPR